MVIFSKITLEELADVSQKILSQSVYPIFILEGEMGSGKTTLAKELLRQLEVQDVVQSPTFGIVNEYIRSNGDPVYHFDLYRLENKLQVLEIGCEEYIDSGFYCFIEWSEKILDLLPEKYHAIRIFVEEDQLTREISFS